jgi:hypothetical protein
VKALQQVVKTVSEFGDTSDVDANADSMARLGVTDVDNANRVQMV